MPALLNILKVIVKSSNSKRAHPARPAAVAIIANPIAGGRRDISKLVSKAADLFIQRDVTYRVGYTGKRGDAGRLTDEALQQGCEAVVVVGGDGTINEVGSRLVGTGVPLGILPCGSGNGLARSLRLPRSLEAACQVILDADPVAVDVGVANERYFFLVAGVGFDARVGERFDRTSMRGPVPYFYLSAREYFTYRPDPIELNFDGRQCRISPFLVAVANGQQYGNNALIAPDAKLNDGQFDICVVHRLRPLDLFSALPKFFRGRIQAYRAAELHRASEVVIKRAAPGVINLDGEPVQADAEIAIALRPRALRIFAPPDSPGLV